MSFDPPSNASDAGEQGARARRRLRWGVVKCPDGARPVDLDVMRRAMTRLLVAGVLTDDDLTMEGVARKAGMSRSTLSRIFSGRAISLSTLLALLIVLGLAFEDVVKDAPMADEGPNAR